MSEDWEEHVESVGPGLHRIKKHGAMRVDAMLVSDAKHLAEHTDQSPGQLANTASLPGIVGNAWAMADFHFGYGFPVSYTHLTLPTIYSV